MPMGIHMSWGGFVRAKAALFAIVMCTTVFAGVVPAHADADTIDNHLCLDTGFGYYGVSDHVHITDTGGTYHISTFGQASAWSYYGSGTYCFQNSYTMPCASYVYADVYENGN